MNKNIHKLIKQIKSVSLTNEERSVIFAKLNQYADSKSTESKGVVSSHKLIKSPFNIFTWQYTKFGRALTYTIASLFIIVFIGGATVFASEKAIPGDILYPIKINISEPLQIALTVSSEKKDRIKVEHVEERLREAEVLAVKGKLSTSTAIKIKNSIDKEVKALRNNISKENLEDLEIKMSAHSVILRSVKEHSNDDQKANVEDIEGAVNRNNEDFKRKDDKVEKIKKIENNKSFIEKKNEVEKEIIRVNNKLKEVSGKSNSLESGIFDHASSSIDKAKEHLKNAEDSYNKNDKERADELIEDSKRDAKEALISAERGLKLREIKDRAENKKVKDSDKKKDSGKDRDSDKNKELDKGED